MEKTKIALDVDGVFLNFFQTTSTFIERHYRFKQAMCYSICQYNLYERFNQEDIDSITFNKIKEEFELHGHWKNLEPMPHIELARNLFLNSNNDITFVTSIPPHLHAQRLHNLSNVLGINIDPDKIICVPLGESKKPHIDKIKPHFFVEDNLNNLIECMGSHKSIWIDLKESYYDRTVLEGVNIKSVSTLNEAVSYIEAKIEKALLTQQVEKLQNSQKMGVLIK